MTVAPIQPASPGNSLARLDAALVAAPLAAVAAKLAALTTLPVTPATGMTETATPDEAVRAAAQRAATRQAGLAPLLADLEAVVRRPDLPQPVRAAIRQVLALRTRTEPPPTAFELKQALDRSGLFFEAKLAQSPPGAQPPAGDLKAALLVFRQVLSAWVGPPQAAATPGPPAAPAAQGAVSPPQVSAQAGRPAAASSAPPQAPPLGPPAPSVAPPTGYAPAAQAIPSETVELAPPPTAVTTQDPVNAEAPVAARTSADRPPATAGQAAPPPPSPPPPARPLAVPPPLLMADEAAAPPLSALPHVPAERALVQAPPANAGGPPPPFRQGPTFAQAPAQAGVARDTDPVAVGQRLLQETDAALARHELHQIASLPGGDAARPGEAQGPKWMFEVPFTTAQGSAVAQFEIGRDGGGGGQGAEARASPSTWSLWGRSTPRWC